MIRKQLTIIIIPRFYLMLRFPVRFGAVSGVGFVRKQIIFMLIIDNY